MSIQMTLLLLLAFVTLAVLAQSSADDINKRAPSGFLGMRGKKDELDNLADNSDYFLSYDDKRAAPSGFLGMRGKKAPSGFLGMRGKKESYDSGFMRDDNDLEDFYDRDSWYSNKRAPSGFLGMRGKKVPSGFFGMRGKKAPSGFLGMRGKKAPSGFLGMRGKKDGSDDPNLDALLYYLLNGSGEEYDVPEDIQGFYESQLSKRAQQKKAPSGFLGMRGKKDVSWSDADDNMSGTQGEGKATNQLVAGNQ